MLHGALLTVTAYSLLTVSIGSALYYLWIRYRARLLRRALGAEIRNAEIDNLRDDRAAPPYLPAEIYRGNLSRLGLLSSEEIDAIIDYYAYALKLEESDYTIRGQETDEVIGEIKVRQQRALASMN